jgi:hypothetical protein
MIPRSLPNLVPGRIDSHTPDVAKRVSFASSDRQVNFRIGAPVLSPAKLLLL